VHTTLAEQDMATQTNEAAAECALELTQATSSVMRATCAIFNFTKQPELLASTAATAQYLSKEDTAIMGEDTAVS
jgi:hypothetical protein